MKSILPVTALMLLNTFFANAQVYNQVTHTSGSQTINGVVVTVTSQNGSTYNNWCGASPYYIGQGSVNNSSYLFSFSPAVVATRFQITATDVGEEMSFEVNNSAYTLTSGNFSAYPGTCNCPFTPAVSTNGNLIMNPSSNTSNGGTQVDIAGAISSIRITGIPQKAGSVFNFLFSSDTAISINNYTDTILCAGDTVQIPFSVYPKYNTGNIFIAQLSDASGSFSNPLNIDTLNSDTSGIMSWVVPGSITQGDGYRIRVVSSSPVRTSNDNGIDIGIGTVIPAKPVANNNSPVCANDTLKLTASSGTSGVSYRWTGPNSFTSGIAAPIIPAPIPANSGDYIVTAYNYGCESKDTTTAVVIAGSGVSNISATANTPICEGGTLQLTGAPSGSSLTYSWIGPDNFSSNQQNPVISNTGVAAAGDYVLYIANGFCTVRDTVTVSVKPLPKNVGITSNSPLCIGDNILLSATASGSGISYSWSGPNSYSASGANVSILGAIATHAGDYYLTADLNGCQVNDTVSVVVKPLPAKPVAYANTPLCERDTLQLASTTTTSGVTYGWTGPAGYTSSVQNPTINSVNTTMTGAYIASANLNGCLAKDTVLVTVQPGPAAVSASTNSPVCAGSTLQLNAGTSTTGTTYSWTGPNSFSASTQNSSVPNATTAATGAYILSLDLNGCMFRDTVSATVYPIPATPSLSYNSPLCIGEHLNLMATNVPGTSYSWTGPNNFSSSVQNPQRTNIQFADTGTYKVTVSANGCTSPAADISVYANPQPFVVVLPSPGDSICQGEVATFTAYANNHGGTPVYQWYINGVLQSATGTTFNSSTLNNNDIVRCDMTEYTKCAGPYTDQGNDVVMKVLPWLAPTVSITADPNRPLEVDEYIKFTAVTTDAGTNPGYQWKRNGTDVIGAKAVTWSANTLNDNDVVSVEIASSYRCPQPPTASSNSITVKVLSSVNDIGNTTTLALHPNPNSGTFFLSGRAEHEVKIEVVNAVGQVIYTDNAMPVSGRLHHTVHMPQAAAGMYIMRVQTNGSLSVMKFRVK